MKKIGYVVTVRELETNKLLATMHYTLEEGPKVVTAEMRAVATKFDCAVIVRGSRQTKLFRDVQWYCINSPATGLIFSRRYISSVLVEPWATIESIITKLRKVRSLQDSQRAPL